MEKRPRKEIKNQNLAPVSLRWYGPDQVPGCVLSPEFLPPTFIRAQPITVTATRGKEGETPSTFATLERQEIRDRWRAIRSESVGRSR